MSDTQGTEAISLDPDCWQSIRVQAHRMLDETFDHLQGCRSQAAWLPMPETIRNAFQTKIPVHATSLTDVYASFGERIQPYALGNIHPGFMGWVQGGGSVIGMLAEMLAGGLNANLGGRDQSPLEVEKEVIDWMRQLFRFPATSSGIFLTGSSIANFVAIVVARNAAMQMSPRKNGMLASGTQLTAYTSKAVHRCVSQALDMAGIGSRWLRKIETDGNHRIDLNQLRNAIQADVDKGLLPFCLIGCAGTVDTGAIDDLESLRQIATENALWFHIDGAFAALGLFSHEIGSKLRGIESADSIAFDFHKWAQVPYDAGFLLVRHGDKHLASFENPADYLSRDQRALSASSPWPCDLGPDLSRSFRALKTWMTFKVYGTKRIGQIMEHTCRLAEYLSDRVLENKELELLAPISLNIVCFRYRCQDADRINESVVASVQLDGRVIPSSTRIDGKFAIRAAIFNHRTTREEIDMLLESVIRQAQIHINAKPSAMAA